MTEDSSECPNGEAKWRKRLTGPATTPDRTATREARRLATATSRGAEPALPANRTRLPTTGAQIPRRFVVHQTESGAGASPARYRCTIWSAGRCTPGCAWDPAYA